jgi:excisionase family DNA binding protein
MILSIKEAAEHLNVSEMTIRRKIKSSDLEYVKEKTPQGFLYRVSIPESIASNNSINNTSKEQLIHANKEIMLLKNIIKSLEADKEHLNNQLTDLIRNQRITNSSHNISWWSKLAGNYSKPLSQIEERIKILEEDYNNQSYQIKTIANQQKQAVTKKYISWWQQIFK